MTRGEKWIEERFGIPQIEIAHMFKEENNSVCEVCPATSYCSGLEDCIDSFIAWATQEVDGE